MDLCEPVTALRGMLSAGPAQRAIRNSNEERARKAIAAAITPYAKPSGEYHLDNKFRYLVARTFTTRRMFGAHRPCRIRI